MAEHSSIEWTEATWNPITGCTLVSEGCRFCYAARLAATRLKHHPSRKGLARMNAAGEAKFTGEVRLNEDWLTLPLRWKRGRMIFPCAHGDLFHESVPDAWIDRVFAVMALTPHHTYQVLTKRSARMRAYFADPETVERIGEIQRREHGDTCAYTNVGIDAIWPLTNVWLGVSSERQQEADQRILDLLATPAAVRFLSAEPLLGPIDLGSGVHHHPDNVDSPELQALTRAARAHLAHEAGTAVIDWVIVGGESGEGARPMHPSWARSLRDQCAAAGVPFFFKQWGTWLPVGQVLPGHGKVHGATAVRPGRMKLHYGGSRAGPPAHAYASRGVEVTATDDGQLAFRIGKKKAGRRLDGLEYSAMPETRR
jgi:protein gp37